MKTLSVKLPKGLHAKLAAAARRRKTTQSALAREALEEYLAGANGAQKGLVGLSAYEVAPHLAGCLDSGISDLSTNKKHMEGFGL